MRGWAALAAAAVALGLSGSAQAAPAAPCDRACLTGFVDRYMAGLADGTVSPAPRDMTVPFSLVIAELFKIQDGKIMRIQALVSPAPYGMTSDWPRQ